MTLESLGMKNGSVSKLTIRFVRALAILSEKEIAKIIEDTDKKTQSKYPRELIKQAINLAP